MLAAQSGHCYGGMVQLRREPIGPQLTSLQLCGGGFRWSQSSQRDKSTTSHFTHIQADTALFGASHVSTLSIDSMIEVPPPFLLDVEDGG